MTSVTDLHPSPPSRNRSTATPRLGRGRLGRWTALLLAVVALAAGCSTGPGTRDEFVEVLTRGEDAGITEEQAGCIADAVFAEYAEDESALTRISSVGSFEDLNGENGVPGFADFFQATVFGCTPVEPG